MTSRQYIYVVFLFFSVLIMNGQTKKTTKNVKSEIDRLSEKYKDSSIIVIYTAFDELEGRIKKKYNIDKKPESIEINIQTKHIDSATDFIKKIISQKYNDGYKTDVIEPESMNFGFWKDNIAQYLDYESGFSFVLTKENMIFKVYGRKSKAIELSGKWFGYSGYILSIETTDFSRKGGKKSSKFDF